VTYASTERLRRRAHWERQVGKEVTQVSQLLERERTRIPVRRRSPILDYTLIVVGALVALCGMYFQLGISVVFGGGSMGLPRSDGQG
jgi:hypothetical protein